MSYKIDFLEEALREWKKLDSAIQLQFKKKLVKVLETPRIPKNKLRNNPDRYKIKLRSRGYRLVYEVKDTEIVVIVVSVGRRDQSLVYKVADLR
ncbi:MAG: type II toxin-antitoxin system RelE/ParE family toxin [Moraxellaceae bacterium]|nr:MAG: type II toxin-antitoxin system RelE/ParE family toxin [Moraxellaceae bacterium]